MNFIEKYNITLQEINDLNESEKKIFESLKTYFEKANSLTEKQSDLLVKILRDTAMKMKAGNYDA